MFINCLWSLLKFVELIRNEKILNPRCIISKINANFETIFESAGIRMCGMTWNYNVVGGYEK